MEIFRSLLIMLVIASGFCLVVMTLVFLYLPKGAINSEINRATPVIDAVQQGREKPSLKYWVNVGYIKIIKNYRRFFLTSIGVMVVSIFILRLFFLQGA
jgi:hypothetical protein